MKRRGGSVILRSAARAKTAPPSIPFRPKAGAGVRDGRGGRGRRGRFGGAPGSGAPEERENYD